MTVDSQVAHVLITPKGIKFTVEQARCFQANTFLTAELFQEYTFKSEDSEEFSVQLSGSVFTFLAHSFEALLDCLNIYGTQCNTVQLQIAYQVSFHLFLVLTT